MFVYLQKKYMNKIEYALKLAKDCTYADEMTDDAKEYLRNVLDEAISELKENAKTAWCLENLENL